MADDLRKLVIEIGASYVGAKGLSRMDRDFDKILGKQKSLAAAARAQADAQIKEATRSSAALQKINDRIALSNRRMEDMMVRQAWAASRGRIQAYQSVTAAIGRENEKIIAMQKTLEREQIASEQRIAAATVQANRARNVARVGAVAGGVGALGTGLIGAGAVGLGAGILAGRSAMNWQTMVSQNVANSPMTPAERRAFQQLAFRTATRTGARPEDVFYALRLGSEMQLGPQQDRRYLQSALALGLPTGGSAAVAPSLQAIATVGHNFPQYARNPRAIANMLLATVQQSAGGINVQQLTANIPSVLAMAGHIGGKSSLADALGAYAALSQTGISAPEISTQMMNFLKVLQSGTARPGSLTNKTLEALRTQRGINLFPDFSQQGLAQKGLGGVLTDIRNANLSQKTLLTLFPNMRGTLAALGLTGNQYQNFMRVQPQIAAAPGQNLIGRNMANYLGLSSTQMEKLNQQLHTLAITTGTQLLPAFNELMKDDIIPAAKELRNLSHEYKDQIVTLIRLSPWLIGAGVGLKALSGGLKLIGGTLALIDAVKAEGVLRGVAVALGLIEGKTAATTALEGVSGAMGKVAPAATAAIGVEGAAGAGTGLLGLAGALAALAAPVGAIIAAAAVVNDPKDAAAHTRYSKTYNVNGQVGHYEYHGRSATWVPGPSPNPPGGSGGPEPSTKGQLLNPATLPPWTVGRYGVPISGSAFGPFGQPESDYQNRNIRWQAKYGEGTNASNARRVAWYHSILGGSGPYTDTDFPALTQKGPGAAPYAPVKLLGSPKKNWTYLGSMHDPTMPANDPNANAEIWRDPSGNKDIFWHVRNPGYMGWHRVGRRVVYGFIPLVKGKKYPGGTQIGMAGYAGGEWHFCIVTSAQGRQSLVALTPHDEASLKRIGYNVKRVGSGGTNTPSAQSLAGGTDANTANLPPAIKKWWPQILAASQATGVPPWVIASYMQVESGGAMYNAQGGILTSSAGALGLMQLMPDTARGLNVDPLNPAQNILGGAKQIAQGMQTYGSNYVGIYENVYNPGVLSSQGGPATVARLKSDLSAYAPAAPVGVNLGKGAALTPVQQWTTRVQGDITQYNARMTAFGWPANTPIGRVQNPARRQLVSGYYNDAVWAYAHQLIAQIQAGPGPEAEKAQATHAVWVAYRNGTLGQQLFGKVPASANARPTTPGGWATWYGARASTLQTHIGAIVADFPGADLTHPSARQRALLGPLLTGPHGLYRTTLEQTLSMDKVIYAGQPKLRELADRAAWGAYNRAMRHPFTYFPATGANQRPTTPMGWSQWYGAQASTRQGEISQLAQLFPGADLSHPNARQRAMLLPLLLGTTGHPGYYKDLLRETLSMDRAIYAGHPHLRAQADRAAWGAYHRELRHPFAYFQGTSATGSQITPVQVVGSNKQLGVAEEHLKVAKQQLAEQKKQTHQEQQQIRHLERVINKLVHWINHHGGHVNVANDYSGVAVTGTAGHP